MMGALCHSGCLCRVIDCAGSDSRAGAGEAASAAGEHEPDGPDARADDRMSSAGTRSQPQSQSSGRYTLQ